MKVIEDIVNDGHGSLNPSYLFIHETANPGATAKNHRDLYSRGYDYAVHYVCDWTGNVYHTMYDNRYAWAVGNGNPFGVSLEICHAKTKDDFTKVWNTAVEFAAWYLAKRGWSISKMMSHDECRIKWGGTDHRDPISYFKKYGKTWADFKNAVSKKMNGTIVTTPSTSTSTTNKKPSTSSSSSSSNKNSSSSFGGKYTCTVNGLQIRTKPTKSAKSVGSFNKGDQVTLDKTYYIADGYVWGTYIASSGNRRYVAVGKATGKVEKDDFLVKKTTSSSSSSSSSKKSITTIAKEVIAGKWGNGDTRKKKLKAAGYDPNAVQKKVNELLKK